VTDREALNAVYPENTWKEAKTLVHKPVNYWRDKANQKAFLDQLAKELNIHSPEDWYTVTNKKVIAMGGSSIMSQYGGSLLRGMDIELRLYWR
jgi:hypothetical protein